MQMEKRQVSDMDIICRALDKPDGTPIEQLLLAISRLLSRSDAADRTDAELAALHALAAQAVPYVAANRSPEASDLAWQLSVAVVPKG